MAKRPSRNYIGKRTRIANSKSLNRRRERVGLPPIELNKQLNNSQTWLSNQWAQLDLAGFGQDWSYVKNLHQVALDMDDAANVLYERQSNTLTFLPFKLVVELYQAQTADVTSTTHYRFMLIKINSMRTVENMEPRDILTDTNDAASLICSKYKLAEDRTWAGTADQNTRFMVLQDFRVTMSNNPALHTGYKKVSINVPGARVRYDPATADGSVLKNGIILGIITTGTHTSANWTFGRNYKLNFFDIL